MLLCGMRCAGMIIRAVAPSSADTANDVDTIRYASPICWYPRTLRAAVTDASVTAARPVTNADGQSRYSRGTWTVDGPQLKAGWMAGVDSAHAQTHQGVVRRQRVRSTGWLVAGLHHPWTTGLVAASTCFGGDNNAMGPRGARGCRQLAVAGRWRRDACFMSRRQLLAAEELVIRPNGRTFMVDPWLSMSLDHLTTAVRSFVDSLILFGWQPRGSRRCVRAFSSFLV